MVLLLVLTVSFILVALQERSAHFKYYYIPFFSIVAQGGGFMSCPRTDGSQRLPWEGGWVGQTLYLRT